MTNVWTRSRVPDRCIFRGPSAASIVGTVVPIKVLNLMQVKQSIQIGSLSREYDDGSEKVTKKWICPETCVLLNFIASTWTLKIFSSGRLLLELNLFRFKKIVERDKFLVVCSRPPSNVALWLSQFQGWSPPPRAFIILVWKSCKWPTVGPGGSNKNPRWGLKSVQMPHLGTTSKLHQCCIFQ